MKRERVFWYEKGDGVTERVTFSVKRKGRSFLSCEMHAK